jgi:hypothetical protein
VAGARLSDPVGKSEKADIFNCGRLVYVSFSPLSPHYSINKGVLGGGWVMFRYVVASCCVLCSVCATADPSKLSGDAIKAIVAGAVLEVDTPLGMKVPLRYSEDGRVSGEARGLAYILGSQSDTGKWWVSSDRLCHKWTKWFDGVLQCLRISQDGSRIFWHRDDGETGTAVISKRGSVVAKALKNLD